MTEKQKYNLINQMLKKDKEKIEHIINFCKKHNIDSEEDLKDIINFISDVGSLIGFGTIRLKDNKYKQGENK
jgi:citrate lyase synthetase